MSGSSNNNNSSSSSNKHHHDNKNEVVMEIQTEPMTSLETRIKGFLAALLYGVCSVSAAFINKMLLATFEFDYPVFIMTVQMIFTISLLELLSVSGVIVLPSYTLSRGRDFLWPAMFYGANAVFSLSALSHMNIAMYGVLKRCVPLTTLVFSVCILKKDRPTKMVIASIVLLTSGCIIAGYGDLSFIWSAYFCGAVSNVTQTLYLLLVQKYATKNQSTVDTLQLNSFNTLPILAITALVNGEMGSVWQYSQYSNPMFIFVFFLTISMGCLLNYSLFLCTGLTSALTTSVVGGLKAMVQTILGIFTFGGISHNVATYLGLSLNLGGGIMYLVMKFKDSQLKEVGLKKVMSFSQMTNGYTKKLNNNAKNGLHVHVKS
ncbi:UDP-galactose/UDP-glucose transporter 7-like [Gigantopelta aegis]|uniref:UDP-galactose/UDP-glucose transporter 7-like n=1 Tax=Gigantopelta aegis TaxID=1735272 RepID=UPI001B888900|nr:UDP-galactose/UDP-glucose transporter 7-like [Gigantopelta aegis]